MNEFKSNNYYEKLQLSLLNYLKDKVNPKKIAKSLFTCSFCHLTRMCLSCQINFTSPSSHIGTIDLDDSYVDIFDQLDSSFTVSSTSNSDNEDLSDQINDETINTNNDDHNQEKIFEFYKKVHDLLDKAKHIMKNGQILNKLQQQKYYFKKWRLKFLKNQDDKHKLQQYQLLQQQKSFKKWYTLTFNQIKQHYQLKKSSRVLSYSLSNILFSNMV